MIINDNDKDNDSGKFSFEYPASTCISVLVLGRGLFPSQF